VKKKKKVRKSGMPRVLAFHCGATLGLKHRDQRRLERRSCHTHLRRRSVCAKHLLDTLLLIL
jgi:hypothetical protein